MDQPGDANTLGPHPLLRCHRLPLPLAWSAYTHSLSFSVSFSEKFSLISQHWVECPLYMFLSLSLLLTTWLAGSYFAYQGLNPRSSAVKPHSPNHWITSEIPLFTCFNSIFSVLSCSPHTGWKCLLKRLPLWLSCELLRHDTLLLDVSPVLSAVPLTQLVLSIRLCSDWMQEWKHSGLLSSGQESQDYFRTFLTYRQKLDKLLKWKLDFHCSPKIGLLQTIGLLFQKSLMGQNREKRPGDESSVHRASLENLRSHSYWFPIKNNQKFVTWELS